MRKILLYTAVFLVAALLIGSVICHCTNSGLLVGDVEIGDSSISFDVWYLDHLTCMKSYSVKEKDGDLYVTVRRGSSLRNPQLNSHIFINLNACEASPRRIVISEWLCFDKTIIDIPSQFLH